MKTMMAFIYKCGLSGLIVLAFSAAAWGGCSSAFYLGGPAWVCECSAFQTDSDSDSFHVGEAYLGDFLDILGGGSNCNASGCDSNVAACASYSSVADCDNSDPAINPGATEICGNGIDEDCSGADLACSSPGYGSTPASGSTLSITGTVGTNPSTTLSVSETGGAQLEVTGITVTGTDAGKFTPSPTSFSIADGGAAQTVTVTCNGSSAGTFSATLNVAHNATGSPATYPLSCAISGSTPVSASVESDLALALTFLGIVLFAAFKMRKTNKA